MLPYLFHNLERRKKSAYGWKSSGHHGCNTCKWHWTPSKVWFWLLFIEQQIIPSSLKHLSALLFYFLLPYWPFQSILQGLSCILASAPLLRLHLWCSYLIVMPPDNRKSKPNFTSWGKHFPEERVQYMIQWMVLLDSSNPIFTTCGFQKPSALHELSTVVWPSMYHIKVYISSLGSFSIFQRQLRFVSKCMDNLTDQPSLLVLVNLCLLEFVVTLFPVLLL